MPDDFASHYIPFTAKGDDSQRIVEGYVSSPAVDCDEQIVDQDWLKSELPDWMLRYGNIREQHDPKRAVGKAQAVDLDSQPGPYLAARIVDDVAWEKVRAGVYNGFSVGIKGPRIVYDGTARNGRITGGKLIEISIVDRPANEAAKFVLLKRAGGQAWKPGESGAVAEEETGMTEQEQTAPAATETAMATEKAAPLDEAVRAGAALPAEPATPTRPAAIGEVMAMLKDVQARVEALAGETDQDRDGDVDTAANREAERPGAGPTRAADFLETHAVPPIATAPPLALTFATEADLTKFISTQVEALLAERGAPSGPADLITKAALAEPLAAIPEIAKLAGGIARGLEALAGRTKATAEDLAATKAAVAEAQADLARVKELAQPVKGAVFAIEKGIGIEPDRIYRDGVIPEGAKRSAEAVKVLAGLSDQDRRLVASEVLAEMYRGRQG